MSYWKNLMAAATAAAPILAPEHAAKIAAFESLASGDPDAMLGTVTGLIEKRLTQAMADAATIMREKEKGAKLTPQQRQALATSSALIASYTDVRESIMRAKRNINAAQQQHG